MYKVNAVMQQHMVTRLESNLQLSVCSSNSRSTCNWHVSVGSLSPCAYANLVVLRTYMLGRIAEALLCITSDVVAKGEQVSMHQAARCPVVSTFGVRTSSWARPRRACRASATDGAKKYNWDLEKEPSPNKRGDTFYSNLCMRRQAHVTRTVLLLQLGWQVIVPPFLFLMLICQGTDMQDGCCRGGYGITCHSNTPATGSHTQ